MSKLTICLIIFALTIISYLWGKLTLATTALCSAVLFFVTGCIDQSVISSSPCLLSAQDSTKRNW